MSGTDSGAANWNVVQLRLVSMNQPQESRAILERRFHEGGFTFEQARAIVEDHILDRAANAQSAQGCLKLWRSASIEKGFTLWPYFWSVFQHGESCRDAVGPMMDFEVPDSVMLVDCAD